MCDCACHPCHDDQPAGIARHAESVWIEADVIRLFNEWEASRSRARLRRLRLCIDSVLTERPDG